MKKIVLTSISAVAVFSMAAQSPIITQDNVYLIGDETPIAWCSDAVQPGDAGENVTWDFSGLTESFEQVFTYFDPEPTLYGYQFPDATLCGVGDNGYHSYYSVSNDHLIVEGYAGYVEEGSDTLKIVYSDTEELLPLPFEFGDTNFDEFSGASQVLGLNINFDGEIDVEVDGYGTLILPIGTFENVVRYHFTRVENNTIFGQTTTETKEQWGWMSPDHRFWLCLMETNNVGAGNDDIVWYSKNPLTLSSTDLVREDITVYPNPVEFGQPVRFSSDVDANAVVELCSVDGKRVEGRSVKLVSGENTITFDRNHSPGLYTFSVLTEAKRMTAKLLIK